jgi:hypothetical protein
MLFPVGTTVNVTVLVGTQIVCEAGLVIEMLSAVNSAGSELTGEAQGLVPDISHL